MSCLFQICSTFILLFWTEQTRSTPLFQGFSVQKGFEVKWQPLQFQPITFFKEIWSPFGRFGMKKEIQKRDLSPPPILSPAPVFEHIEESILIDKKQNNIEATVVCPEPELFKPLSSNLLSIPLGENFNSIQGLYTNINRDLPENNISENPGQLAIKEVYGELPPRPVGPMTVLSPIVSLRPVSPMPLQPVSPMSIHPVSPMQHSVSPVLIQPGSSIPIHPVNPIQQSISPVFIQPPTPMPVQPGSFIPGQVINPSPVQPVGLVPGQILPPVSPGVIPIITPPPGSPVAPNFPLSEIPPTEGPLVRGSKLALYFGKVFMQLVSQFLTNARLRISQMKSSIAPPPVPNN